MCHLLTTFACTTRLCLSKLTCVGDARVLDGHAFIVEAAVSVGGRDIKPGINVNRFANRIPLLFEACTAASFSGCQALRYILMKANGCVARRSEILSSITSQALNMQGQVLQRTVSSLHVPCYVFAMLLACSLQMLALLQGGSDVITRTATKRINWAAYKINQATDRVGVFVSIVSTKIPYKGAGKEYICAPHVSQVAAMGCETKVI